MVFADARGACDEGFLPDGHGEAGVNVTDRTASAVAVSGADSPQDLGPL